ncbi:MAG: ABC transporter substrate-binding protein [Burkholderiales bacterium]|jgi:ABC-type branched-subunit amino acid transport system substrate-binding protein
MQTWKLALAAAACAFGAATAQAQDIRIGANLPMSGPNSEYGELFSNAAKLAVDHINADKMLSKKLELVIEDSQAQPQQGVVAMNKLVNVEKVPFVLSAFTAVSKAVAPVGDKAHVVTVNGGAIGPDLAELGDYFWNVIPLVNLEVQAMAPYLVKERGFKKIALVYVDDPAGEAIRKELETHVPKNGGALVAAIQVPRASQQFSGVAAKVREASPDLVYIASFGAQQAQIAKQLRDNGVAQQLASYSAYSAPTAAQLPESKGALYTTQVINWSGDALSQRVARDWQAKTGKEPSAYIANYYNAVLIFAKLAQALEKAGQPITGENLLKQRKSMASFDVVGGKLTFLPNGTVSVPLQVNETDGGAGKAVKTNIVVAP